MHDGELVKVVTDPTRPHQAVKMLRKAADAYVKANPEAVILDAAPAEPEPETKAVEKTEPAVEDKAVTFGDAGVENKAGKKAPKPAK